LFICGRYDLLKSTSFFVTCFARGALDSNKAKEKILFFYLGDPDDELTENQKAKETYSVGAIRLVLG
jgi:hypothetical protein